MRKLWRVKKMWRRNRSRPVHLDPALMLILPYWPSFQLVSLSSSEPFFCLSIPLNLFLLELGIRMTTTYLYFFLQCHAPFYYCCLISRCGRVSAARVPSFINNELWMNHLSLNIAIILSVPQLCSIIPLLSLFSSVLACNLRRNSEKKIPQ